MFYDRVKALCDERGVSIAKLEKDAKIGNGTIGGWRDSIPNVETIQKVAKYFNVPLSVLIEED